MRFDLSQPFSKPYLKSFVLPGWGFAADILFCSHALTCGISRAMPCGQASVSNLLSQQQRSGQAAAAAAHAGAQAGAQAAAQSQVTRSASFVCLFVYTRCVMSYRAPSGIGSGAGVKRVLLNGHCLIDELNLCFDGVSSSCVFPGLAPASSS